MLPLVESILVRVILIREALPLLIAPRIINFKTDKVQQLLIKIQLGPIIK
jgi:hypothetical protein